MSRTAAPALPSFLAASSTAVFRFRLRGVPQVRAPDADARRATQFARRLRLLHAQHRGEHLDVVDRARQPADRIDRVGGRPGAHFIDGVVGRLVAEDAAERRRPQHRAAGLRAERRRHHVVGDRGRRAARRTAGRVRGIVRVGGFRRRAAGKFASRRLAEDERAGAAQQRHAGGVRLRAIAAIDRRTHLGRPIVRVDGVFQSDGNAVQRPARRCAIERARLSQREIRHRNSPTP